jgi:hypothetical protein
MLFKMACKITAILILFVSSTAGCAGFQSPPPGSPTPAESGSAAVLPTNTLTPAVAPDQTTPTPGLSDYAFPVSIDPAARYLFYLHGKIIEDQGLPAISPEYGEYHYLEILEALRSHGFVVISEQRPANAEAGVYARRVGAQVASLLDSGVPPGSITVVGASKGAAIAILVSDLVADPGVSYVLLGACDADTSAALIRQGVTLSGNVLAISDASDEYAGSCADLFAVSEEHGLARHAEIVLHVGTGHGLLYEPLPEWVLPAVQWAGKP